MRGIALKSRGEGISELVSDLSSDSARESVSAGISSEVNSSPKSGIVASDWLKNSIFDRVRILQIRNKYFLSVLYFFLFSK